LYPPAFAALTRWYGSRAVGALTVLTLAGGLASTTFAPITAALAGQLGWRGTYLVLAVVLALVTVPGHLLGLNRPWPAAPATTHLRPAPDRVVRSTSFLALVTALALAACASYAVVVNLVPLLTERNLPLGMAAVALALGGAGQVMGRLCYRQLSRWTGVRTRTTLTLAGVAVTTALLAAVTSLAAILVMAVAAGVVRGIATLVQATAVTDRWGASHYGQLSGVLAAPVTVTAAVAPWAGAVLAGLLGSYAAMFWVMAGIAATAGLLGLASVPAPRTQQSDERSGPEPV
jgi:MFS family permease